MPLAYPVARIYDDGTVLPIPWTEETLHTHLLDAIGRIRKAYGGEWLLEIRNNTVQADLELRRRWPPLPRLKTLKTEPPRQKVASRQMLDRMVGARQSIPGLGQGPVKFDPENDPDLQGLDDAPRALSTETDDW